MGDSMRVLPLMCVSLAGCATLATSDYQVTQTTHDGVSYEVRYRYTPENFMRWISVRPTTGILDPKDDAAGVKATAALIQFGTSQTCTPALLPKRPDVAIVAQWKFAPQTLQHHTEKTWSDKPFLGAFGKCHPNTST